MIMQKNEHILATCIDYTYEGVGVVKVDGFPLFVKDMMVGEEGEIVVTKLGKSYGYGRLLTIHKASKYREKPRCPIYKQCGGCQLQHFSFEHQKAFKEDIVRQNLRSIAHLDIQIQPIISMEDPWAYRNKLQIPFGTDKTGTLVSGFYRQHSHDIIPFDHCYLQSKRANAIIRDLTLYANELCLQDVLRHVLIRDMEETQEVMLVLVVYRTKDERIRTLAERIYQAYPMIRSIIENYNPEDTNVVLGKQQQVLIGSNEIHAQLDDLTFQISAHSFFQVNTKQAERLYRCAVDLANVQAHEKAVDVYCGVGGITMYLAKKAREVIGIEIVPSAIENAKINMHNNGINNITFMCGDAKSCTQQLVANHHQVDVAVVDPPRKGCDENTLESLIMMNPKRIVYVSCNPGTLARDVKWLYQHGFVATLVQPVDMFPQTHHVETVCLLTKVQK